MHGETFEAFVESECIAVVSLFAMEAGGQLFGGCVDIPLRGLLGSGQRLPLQYPFEMKVAGDVEEISLLRCHHRQLRVTASSLAISLVYLNGAG